MRLDERRDLVEDRLEAQLEALRRGGLPPPVLDGLEAPVFFLDDPEPVRSRPWVDADDLHAATLGSASDVSCTPTGARTPPWQRISGLPFRTRPRSSSTRASRSDGMGKTTS